VRVALVAVALLAAGWFAIGMRQARDVDHANAIVSGSGQPSAAQARRASSLLSAAAFLNPDRQVDVLRAQLEREQGDLRGARKILKRVVSTEPENLLAWVWLARSSIGDLKDFYAAAYRIRQLLPPVPPAP
jgi:Tetratricopeptide repeat